MFTVEELFKRTTDNVTVQENYTITGDLPMQIVQTGKISQSTNFDAAAIVQMQNIADKGKSTLIYFLIGNIALQVVM